MAYLILEDSLQPLPGAEAVTYRMYCEALDRLARGGTFGPAYFESAVRRSQPLYTEGLWDDIKARAKEIPGQLTALFGHIKEWLSQIGKDFGVGVQDIVVAFKQRDVWALLKAVGFNIGILLKAVNQASAALRGGLIRVFEELHKTKVFQKIRDGVMTVDEVLAKYPVLKKIGGIAVAGLLLYIWMSMSFSGSHQYDLDLSDIINALKGHYNLAELFTSPQGLSMLALLGVGLATSGPDKAAWGIHWLGTTGYNLVLAILYTGLQKAKQHTEFWKKLRAYIPVSKFV